MRFGLVRLLTLSCVLLVTGTMLRGQDSANRKGIKENRCLKIDTARDIVSVDKLYPQSAPGMEQRGQDGRFIPLVAGYLITKGIREAQKLINDRKSRYISQDSYTVDNEYFYDQISAKNSFDPSGIIFKGFEIMRIEEKSKTEHDTVFFAKFILDTTGNKIEEIINNGIFRLRLDSLYISSTKVKMPRNARLSMDFEINFTSTYRSDNGQVFMNAPLGKFVYPLRNAPVHPGDTGYARYYSEKCREKPSLTGYCFTVPRSAGFYKNPDTKAVELCWGPGLYAISVTVKETSKEKFVDKVLVLSSDPVLTVGGSSLQNKIGNASPGAKKP
jgi:hypothetical protein